jgi:hypothetical protein
MVSRSSQFRLAGLSSDCGDDVVDRSGKGSLDTPSNTLTGITKKASLDIQKGITTINPCLKNKSTAATILHDQQQQQRAKTHVNKNHISPKATESSSSNTNTYNKAKLTSPRSASVDLLTTGSHQKRSSHCGSGTTSESESDNETHQSCSSSQCSTTITTTSSGGGKKSAFFKAKRKEKLRIRFDIEESNQGQVKKSLAFPSWKESSPGLIIGRQRSFQVTTRSFTPSGPSSSFASSVPRPKGSINPLGTSPSFCFGTQGRPKDQVYFQKNQGFYRVTGGDPVINSSVDSGISLGNHPTHPNILNPNFPSSDETLLTKKPKRSLKKLLTKSRSFVLSSSSSSRDRDQRDIIPQPIPPAPTPGHLNFISRAELVAKYHHHHQHHLSVNNFHPSKGYIGGSAGSVLGHSSQTSSTSLPRPTRSFRVFPRSSEREGVLCLNRKTECDCCPSQCQPSPIIGPPCIIHNNIHNITNNNSQQSQEPTFCCEECKLLKVCTNLNLCRNCGGTVDDGVEKNHGFHPHPATATFHPNKSWVNNNNNNYTTSTMPQPLKGKRVEENSYFHGKYSKLPLSSVDQDQQNEFTPSFRNNGDFLSLNLSLNRLYKHHHQYHSNSPPYIRTAEDPHLQDQLEEKDRDKDKLSKKGISGSSKLIKKKKLIKQSSDEEGGVVSAEMALSRMNELVHHHEYHDQERVEMDGGSGNYHSYYDCRIPRPKLKFVVPTHSYGVSTGVRSSASDNSNSGEGITSTALKQGRKAAAEGMQDLRGFSEVSLSSDGGNEDGAYASGGGSSSSHFRSEHNSSEDYTLSEFEREQEQIAMRFKQGRSILIYFLTVRK